jgi:hypothetical protein
MEYIEQNLDWLVEKLEVSFAQCIEKEALRGPFITSFKNAPVPYNHLAVY